MKDINERPVCHRAEDLVTYLYGEAGEADARDFANHLQQCDACRSEFAVFNQVHDSILLWRNEALGSSLNPAALVTESTIERNQFVHERKLSALAALREFFSVSPLWLRGATAFAALLLCVLGLVVVSRSWKQSAPVAKSSTEDKVYTATQLRAAVDDAVSKTLSENRQSQTSSQTSPIAARNQDQVNPVNQQRTEIAGNSGRSQRARLTRAEREQLLADLRLTPGRDEEEPPLTLPDEPNQ